MCGIENLNIVMIGGMSSSQNSDLLQAMAAELKYRRTRLGMTQDELAKASRLNRTYLGKLEAGRNQPSITALFKLARGLDTSPEELLAAAMIRYYELTNPENRPPKSGM